MADLLNALTGGLQAALGYQAIFFALLAIGLNVHFGYTGLLNFGQIAFAMLGGFGIAVSVVRVGAALLGRRPRRHRRRVVLALLLGSADAAPAGRLPGHRHHRGGRGPAAAVPVGLGHARHRRHPGPVGLQRRLRRAGPLGRPDASTTSSARAGAAPSCGSRSSAGSSWRCAACSSGPSCAARGAGWSRRSARTRTPPARSARTSTRTRCRRSSSVVSSARSAGWSTPWAPARRTPTSTRTPTPSSPTPP